MFPKIGVFTPQNGWFIMESPIKMDDLGVPLFLETPIFWRYRRFKIIFVGRPTYFEGEVFGISTVYGIVTSIWYIKSGHTVVLGIMRCMMEKILKFLVSDTGNTAQIPRIIDGWWCLIDSCVTRHAIPWFWILGSLFSDLPGASRGTWKPSDCYVQDNVYCFSVFIFWFVWRVILLNTIAKGQCHLSI